LIDVVVSETPPLAMLMLRPPAVQKSAVYMSWVGARADPTSSIAHPAAGQREKHSFKRFTRTVQLRAHGHRVTTGFNH
jgi:hypothetical protein